MKRFLVAIVLLTLAACGQAPTPEAGAPSELAPLFGSSSRDEAYGLAKHSTGVYVVGNAGGNTFIRKSGASGNVLWDKYLGTSLRAKHVASDSYDNAYVVGTYNPEKRKQDLFIRKYKPDGGIAWTKHFSDRNARGWVQVRSVAANGSGNLYVVTYDNGFHLSKYSASGSRLWTHHSNTHSYRDVAVDRSGYVYVAGVTSSSLNSGNDMSIHKFDAFGRTLWTRQIHYNGFRRDGVVLQTAVAVSGNHVYLVGNYLWNDTTAYQKVAVTKYNADGVQQWSRPYGLNGLDEALDASADEGGNLYVAGRRYGGPHPQGVGFVIKVSPDFGGREL